MYPAKIFSSVDFPAPEGPITAVSLPAEKVPETDFKIVLKPLSRKTNESQKVVNLIRKKTESGKNYIGLNLEGRPHFDLFLNPQGQNKTSS